MLCHHHLCDIYIYIILRQKCPGNLVLSILEYTGVNFVISVRIVTHTLCVSGDSDWQVWQASPAHPRAIATASQSQAAPQHRPSPWIPARAFRHLINDDHRGIVAVFLVARDCRATSGRCQRSQPSRHGRHGNRRLKQKCKFASRRFYLSALHRFNSGVYCCSVK